MGTVREAAAAIASIGGPDEGPAVVWSDETHAACKKGQQLWLDALENGEFTPPGAKEPFVLAPFVLIGATTNPGQLLRPLLDRFTVRESLDFYSTGEIEKILRRYAGIEGFAFDDAGYAHLAAVGRGTPRIANAILRRVARFGEVADLDAMTGPDVEKALAQLGIDEFGLDPLDRRILKDGLAGQDSPIGIEALADMLCLDSDAVTNREPYLMRTRLIKRLSGGRVLTKHGYHVLRCVDKEFTMPTPPWVGL
jgi:Holliday junction DNA helicase RuvB